MALSSNNGTNETDVGVIIDKTLLVIGDTPAQVLAE